MLYCLLALCRIHYEIMAQLVDPAQLTAGGGSHGAIDSGMYQLGSLSLGSGGGHYGSAPTLSPAAESLPFNSLTSFGLQAETVRQLSEMKVYLQRQFGLELSIAVSKDNLQAAKSLSHDGGGDNGFYAQQGGGMIHPHPAAMNPPVAVSAQPQWTTYGNANSEEVCIYSNVCVCRMPYSDNDMKLYIDDVSLIFSVCFMAMYGWLDGCMDVIPLCADSSRSLCRWQWWVR